MFKSWKFEDIDILLNSGSRLNLIGNAELPDEQSPSVASLG